MSLQEELSERTSPQRHRAPGDWDPGGASLPQGERRPGDRSLHSVFTWREFPPRVS